MLRALRTVSTCVEVAVFLWRRYSSAAQNPTPAPYQHPDVLVHDASEGRGDTTEEDASSGPTQTVCFGLDGQSFEIDLSDEAAAELRTVFDRYITAGRRVGRRMKTVAAAPAVARTGTGREERQSPAAIREWAREHGYRVSVRGPIPAAVREAYASRHLVRAG